MRKQAHHLCSERQFPLQCRQVREKALVFKHSGHVIATEIKSDTKSTLFTYDCSNIRINFNELTV